MTSNIGSQAILEEKDAQAREKRIQEILRKTLRPEFLNRIDDVVVFQSLGAAEVRRIVQQLADRLNGMLREREIEVRFTDRALDWLAEKGFDPDFGARPLKRVFQREVQDPLAMAILDHSLKAGAAVTADVSSGSISFAQPKF